MKIKILTVAVLFCFLTQACEDKNTDKKEAVKEKAVIRLEEGVVIESIDGKKPDFSNGNKGTLKIDPGKHTLTVSYHNKDGSVIKKNVVLSRNYRPGKTYKIKRQTRDTRKTKKNENGRTPINKSGPRITPLSNHGPGFWKNGQMVRTSKKRYAPDEQIVVYFRGFPGNDTDWITVAPAQSTFSTTGDRIFLKGRKEGTITFKGKAYGTYEVRGYFNWPKGGFNIRANWLFVVK